MTMKSLKSVADDHVIDETDGSYTNGEQDFPTTNSYLSVDENQDCEQQRNGGQSNGIVSSVDQPVPPSADYNNPTLRQRNADGKKQYAVSTRWEVEYEARQREKAELSANRMFCKNCHYCSSRCTFSLEDFYNYCCCFARRRVGDMFFLMERTDGSPVVVAGPCWPFCVFVTVPIIILVVVVVSYFIFYEWEVYWWVALIYFPIVAFTVVSLCMVSCRDPGLIERVTDGEVGRSREWIWNEQTASFRPSGAMYCRECKVLIQDYDHLCPWTGTGIGRGNMIAFRVFVVSINILCYVSVILLAVAGIMSLDRQNGYF